MKSIIRFLLTIITLVSFSACGNMRKLEISPDNEAFSSQVVPPTQEEQTTKENDIFYPINKAYAWLKEGTILAVPNQGEIQYIDLNNQLVKKITISEDKLIGDYRFALSDYRIFVAGGYNGGRYFSNLSACKTENEWVLTGGSIWDDNGNLLREFQQYE